MVFDWWRGIKGWRWRLWEIVGSIVHRLPWRLIALSSAPKKACDWEEVSRGLASCALKLFVVVTRWQAVFTSDPFVEAPAPGTGWSDQSNPLHLRLIVYTFSICCIPVLSHLILIVFLFFCIHSPEQPLTSTRELALLGVSANWKTKTFLHPCYLEWKL